ncbi:MAG: preprotein translocase subunit YajC [Bacteroidota bacterium]|nr:preprotein translocase subunit YajC [Bacteroidota bacterium]
MNNLFLLLDAGAAAGQQSNPYTMWIMLGLLFVVFYFFMIRPQNKKQKELKKFRESLNEGDKVVTIGGIYGKVAQIKEDGSILLEIDANVRIRMDKSSIVKDTTDSAQQIQQKQA